MRSAVGRVRVVQLLLVMRVVVVVVVMLGVMVLVGRWLMVMVLMVVLVVLMVNDDATAVDLRLRLLIVVFCVAFGPERHDRRRRRTAPVTVRTATVRGRALQRPSTHVRQIRENRFRGGRCSFPLGVTPLRRGRWIGIQKTDKRVEEGRGSLARLIVNETCTYAPVRRPRSAKR